MMAALTTIARRLDPDTMRAASMSASNPSAPVTMLRAVRPAATPSPDPAAGPAAAPAAPLVAPAAASRSPSRATLLLGAALLTVVGATAGMMVSGHIGVPFRQSVNNEAVPLAIRPQPSPQTLRPPQALAGVGLAPAQPLAQVSAPAIPHPAVQALPVPDAAPSSPAIAADPVATPAPVAPSPETALILDLAKRLDGVNQRLAGLQTQLQKQIADNQAQLSTEMDTNSAKVAGRLDELEHREDLADLAARQGRPVASEVVSRPQRAARSTPADGGTASSDMPAAPSHPAERLPRYRIQASATDLAVLMDANGNSVEVKPGSVLDGWGRVLSVTQRGADWIVTTEHGTIH